MKRFVDFCLAVLGLTVLLPVLGLVALAIKLTSPGPIIFRQVRLGQHGRRFRIYKFRTMVDGAAAQGHGVTAGNDRRITPLGRLLRRSKLDELPQVLNVLRGDMSFVGPRPEVPEFAELFPAQYERILRVKPGITHAATMRFRREEEILGLAHDPRQFYVDQVMPCKLADYEATLEQGVLDDIVTIVKTVMPFMGLTPYGPDHFSSGFAMEVEPIATVVENVPAFGMNATPKTPAVQQTARAV